MADHDIEILSSTPNATVVRIPGRRFPGVVIQGDSLRNLYGLVKQARTTHTASGRQETSAGGDAGDLLSEAETILRGYLLAYESALKSHQIRLPYSKAISESESEAK